MTTPAYLRRLLGVLVALTSLSVWPLSAAGATGESEPNDTRATATPLGIGLGNALSARIDVPGDVDHYRFEADRAGAFVIEVVDADAALGSVSVFVEDDQGWQCCWSDQGGDYTVAARASVVDAVAGRSYSIRVDTTSVPDPAGTTGAYRIRVLRSHDNGGPEWDPTGEPDGAFDTAHEIPLGTWVSGEVLRAPAGILSPLPDHDSYRFLTEPDTVYTVRVRSDTTKAVRVVASPEDRDKYWQAPTGSGWLQTSWLGGPRYVRVTAGEYGSYEICAEGPGVSCSSGVTRIGGADRHETAALTSATLPSDTKVAFIAASGDFPDALAGSALAGRLGGPVLLVPPTGIPSAVDEELLRLRPRQIVVLGGAQTISEDTFRRMADYATMGSRDEVVRLAGADRYETAARVAAWFEPSTTDVVYIATGADFPDALSAAALAGVTGGPVLLTRRDELSLAAREQIYRLAPKRIVILGGESRVSDSVLADVVVPGGAGTEVVRIAGADRYETSALIAQHFPAHVGEAYVATGRLFPDALAGAARAGWSKGPVLIVPGTTIPSTVATELSRLRPEAIVVLGGVSAVSTDVERALATYVR